MAAQREPRLWKSTLTQDQGGGSQIITHACPMSLMCAGSRLPSSTFLHNPRQLSPAGGCGQALPCAHPGPGRLPFPSVPCHRPDTWEYRWSARLSHVIPGTLWHMNRGVDIGRGKVGRTGNRSLLTASSGAVWSGSGCCRCHAGSSGGATASRWPRRAACMLSLPEECCGQPPVAYSVAICSMWSLSSLYCSSSRLPITACFFRKSLHSFLFSPKASML